ncbi:MAG: cytochrome oxidase maturation protein, cbb3-type [Sorangiineae bacterium NIC37A_2]|jgi:cbb3-type cytochrome oxidase maturation protein|nr:MAG: cytochrome oxidase maturation protein, cbb3-type [Sorangiineae bacterium NIC37A_2]
MSVLFVVLPIALLASAAAVFAFVWASRSGQLDDLETPALRAIDEDDRPGAACVSSAAASEQVTQGRTGVDGRENPDHLPVLHDHG